MECHACSQKRRLDCQQQCSLYPFVGSSFAICGLTESSSAHCATEDVMGEIDWSLALSGKYSPESAYKAQFFEASSSPVSAKVWKIWAPPKIKFFAWLIVQNKLWMADREAGMAQL
jgi:hypothetical protein